MALTASEADSNDIALLIEDLESCTPEHLPIWLAAHRDQLSLAFLQQLKDTRVTSSHILENPTRTDQLTRCALAIGGLVAYNQPLALALAQWMRGLWAMFNAMADAVVWFRSAIPAYAAVHDELSVARLSSNLVAVLAAVGENAAAEEYYHQARPIFERSAAQDPRFLIYLEQNFGWLLHTWGRYEDALQVHEHALHLALEHNLAISIAEIQVNRSLTLARLGRFGEVEEMLKKARAIAVAAGELVTVARIDMNLGDLYTSLGRPAEALHCFYLAEAGFVEMEQSSVQARQATLLRQLGALPAALRQYELALASMELHALKPFYAETLVQYAICLRLVGDAKSLRLAENALTQAQELWQSLGSSLRLAQLRAERIILAVAKADYDGALALLHQYPLASASPKTVAEYQLLCAETHRLTGDPAFEHEAIAAEYEAVLAYATPRAQHWVRRTALNGLGQLWAEVEWDKGRKVLEEAAAIDDELRRTLTLQELKASFHEQANDIYDNLIRQAFHHGQTELVLCYAWRAKASAFLELARTLHDEQKYSSEQRQAIDRLRRQIASRRWLLAEAASGAINERYEVGDAELADLTEQLLALRRQANQQGTPTYNITATNIAAVLAAMDADLLLEYVRCGDEYYGICATKEGVHNVKLLAGKATIGQLVARLAFSFQSINSLEPDHRNSVSAAKIEACKSLLQQCYAQLVSPFADALQSIKAGGKFLIAPCDLISLLPFAAFWTGDQYWIERYELELIPSGAALLLPEPCSSSLSPAVIVAAATEQIVAVRDEAAAVAATIDPSVTFVDEPVLDYINALPAPPRILHLAAHAIQRSDAPFFSGIQLHDEVLSVEHCYDLPLWGTELVVLSGCATAAGMDSEASLFAFQSACLLAGARRLLCTLWPIADDIPPALMEHFYGQLNEGIGASAALRLTQLAFLRHPSYRHPALWAAFTCVRR